jgi:hypothetical protein
VEDSSRPLAEQCRQSTGMKAKLRLPRTRLGWLFLVLFVVNVLIGSWPVIPLFNQNTIVLGLPLLILWSYIIVFTTVFLMWLATRMGIK